MERHFDCKVVLDFTPSYSESGYLTSIVVYDVIWVAVNSGLTKIWYPSTPICFVRNGDKRLADHYRIADRYLPNPIKTYEVQTWNQNLYLIAEKFLIYVFFTKL